MNLEDVKTKKIEELEEHNWFKEDELYAVEPIIYEMIEEGDLEGLTQYLRKVGGY